MSASRPIRTLSPLEPAVQNVALFSILVMKREINAERFVVFDVVTRAGSDLSRLKSYAIHRLCPAAAPDGQFALVVPAEMRFLGSSKLEGTDVVSSSYVRPSGTAGFLCRVGMS